MSNFIDKASAQNWAREMLDLPAGKVLILDTETCDFNGEIIELGIIDIDGNALYSGRFRPLTDVSPGAYAVHGISTEMLAYEPRFDVEHRAIHAILDQAERVLIYNAPFDVRCLTETCKLHRVASFELSFKATCIMRVYAQWVGERGRGGYKKQKLTGGDHSALGDARAALALVRKMAEVGEKEIHG